MRSAVEQASSIVRSLETKAELEAKEAQLTVRYQRTETVRLFHAAARWWRASEFSKCKIHFTLVPAAGGYTVKTWTTGGECDGTGRRLMFHNLGDTTKFPMGAR